MVNPAFQRYIGIDYSGAQTPKSSLKGLRVYEADRLNCPQEVESPPKAEHPRLFGQEQLRVQHCYHFLNKENQYGTYEGIRFPVTSKVPENCNGRVDIQWGYIAGRCGSLMLGV